MGTATAVMDAESESVRLAVCLAAALVLAAAVRYARVADESTMLVLLRCLQHPAAGKSR